MSVTGLVLLVAALVLLGVFEAQRRGVKSPRLRPPRPARKRHLRVVEAEADPDEFQRAVERDLANLPTFDPRAKRD